MLSMFHNPGCEHPINCSSFKVGYVKAEGPNDTLHYLWDFTQKPSILVAAAPAGSNLTISWSQFKAGNNKSIMFSEEPVYSFGIVLDRIWEYNDVNDSGLMDRKNKNSSYVRALDMENFNWTLSDFANESMDTVDLKVESSSFTSKNSNALISGSIRFVLSAFSFRDHFGELPHLLHSANSTQVDLVLDKLKTNSSFSNSRFALEVLIASSDKVNSTASIVSQKSLDDEYSPGVFTLVHLQTPMAELGKGGYLQWRPVAYVAKERDISYSTETSSYGVTNVKNRNARLNHTLLYAYYCSHLDNLLVQSTIVSFGLKEDGFYKKTNYTSWTFVVGYGTPPNEDFSLLVIFVISIGLGLPALLIIISGIVVAVRRISQKKDDLFLNR
ncbi:glycosylated lysosomal membrane protein-like isoform X2 [Zootermopsis nevadensis]|uniref:glycosylated lysosomal membrane protein-like isoform X2 n=1 Tax=Zootermopsis nevadensis TaxID=136037 RepID=UPI000B8EAC02|nr:glycosylated lysosomal membrane protein-like isoform X2 [Zootermopsis nevadensis]